MSTETMKVERSIGYASGVLVVFEDSSEGRRVVARIPNKGYPIQAQRDAIAIKAIPDVRKALRAAEKLLDGVAFVSVEGDTDETLALIRGCLARVRGDA